jgi:hypothetical protein
MELLPLSFEHTHMPRSAVGRRVCRWVDGVRGVVSEVLVP